MVFILSAFWWIRIRGLWKLPDGRDWLKGKLGLILMGRAMLSKSLTQFSVDGQSCVSSLLFDLRPNYGGGNENRDLLVKVPCMHCWTHHPNPAAGHHQPTPPPETHGHSWARLGQPLVGSVFLFPGSWCTQGFVCALQESVSQVLCKFWWLCGRVNGDLLQEGLCHTHVCCTPSPCPCSRPLLIHTSAGDSQTQFWLTFASLTMLKPLTVWITTNCGKLR